MADTTTKKNTQMHRPYPAEKQAFVGNNKEHRVHTIIVSDYDIELEGSHSSLVKNLPFDVSAPTAKLGNLGDLPGSPNSTDENRMLAPTSTYTSSSQGSTLWGDHNPSKSFNSEGGTEHNFKVENNKFLFSPGQLVRRCVLAFFETPEVVVSDEYQRDQGLEEIREGLAFIKRVRGGCLSNLKFVVQHPKEAFFKNYPNNGPATVMAGVIACGVAGWPLIDPKGGENGSLHFARNGR